MNQINIQQMPLGANNQPNAFFRKDWFDNVIYNQGYDIFIEKAHRCPCKSKGTDNLSSCKNCSGTGWFFINKTQTKAILHSMNLNTKFKEWSETNLGNVNISVRDVDKLSFMDRITVIRGESIHTQVVYPVKYKQTIFSFLDYKPISIEEVFLFDLDSKPLKLLSLNEDYTILNDKIIFDNKYWKLDETFTVSIRYSYNPQFHLIDLTRDIMYASIKDQQGKIVKGQMPISGIARRSHYVLDRQNFNQNLIFDNSYIKDSCEFKIINISGYCIQAPVQNILPQNPRYFQVVFDTITSTFKYFNGSIWVDLGSQNTSQIQDITLIDIQEDFLNNGV